MIRHGCRIIALSASHRSGTAPLHLRAGTGAFPPRCEPRAAARAGPSSPPPLRSPRTRTPPACGSSGPHPCGCQSLPRRRFPGQAQAQPGWTSVSAITFIGFPGRPERVDLGQRRSPYAAAPGQSPGTIPSCPMLVALKMLLQIAARNIGQLTDIEPSPPYRAGDPGSVEAVRRAARPAWARLPPSALAKGDPGGNRAGRGDRHIGVYSAPARIVAIHIHHRVWAGADGPAARWY
jgi:hypothetical protein